MGLDFVPDSLVAPPVVVIVNKTHNSTPQCGYIVLRFQADVFSLDGPPKALYPDIVKASGLPRRNPPRDPRRHPEKTSATTEETHRHPEKSAKNHENMAKRAKNVLLAISSGGGYFYIFVAMVKS